MRKENSIITIQELLRDRGVDFDAKKVKLVRHDGLRTPRIQGNIIYDGTLYEMYRYDYQKFIDFQNEQKIGNFKNVDYIVSFISEEGTKARLIGVYRNLGIKNIIDDDGAIFDFQEIKDFSCLKDRIVIEWGKGARSWIQNWETAKEVIRIDEGLNNRTIPLFTRYEDVLLSFADLKNIIESNDSEWKSVLEACNCVYLILDKSNGKQYVGVTYKNSQEGQKGGIWNRWAEYVHTKGHGNDKTLKEKCENNPYYAELNFQWSILEVLPINVIPTVAIDRETLYKKKLGTRENDNYNNN